MQINDKIKEVRQLLKMSQQAFADLLEEKRSTYAEWEDKIIPSFDKIVNISSKTGVSILEFVAAIDDKVAIAAINVDISSLTKNAINKEEKIRTPIELKTANGEIIQVVPKEENQIKLLNAFFLERDRVIDNKQDRIEELIKDKDQLYKLLNSDLKDLSRVQKASFAMIRTGLEYEAAIASQGDKKKEVEMLNSLTKLNHKNLKVDATKDIAVALQKQRLD